jgi:ABC-type dipeptide/oligopeptide/nickel transport system ATPase component
VCFNGDDLLTKPEAQMRRLRGQAIALIVSNARAQLNPIVPVGRQMMNVIRAHRKDVAEAEARRKVQALIASVGIGDPARVMGTYPHELSGGMCQRILIAMALSNNPKLLLADEPSSGLDVTVQLHVLELMRSLVRDFAAATIIMTRDLGIVAHYCQRVVVLHDGEIIETGDVRSFFAQPQHPYSRELLRKNFAAVGAEAEGGPAQ